MTVGVLFVCTGNICRSPTAEGVFRHLAKQSGLAKRLLIDSCGTQGYHVGDPPDPRSIATARRHGVDLSTLRARQLRAADFQRFDYVLAMDRGHLQILERQNPGDGRTQLGLFLEHAGGGEVPDPYYGDDHGFEQVYRLIATGAAALLEYIGHQHPGI